MNQGGLTARCICIWPNVCVNMHDGTHLGHIRSGAIDRHDHHGHLVRFGLEFTFPAEVWKEMERKGTSFKGPGRLSGAGRPPGLHHPIASSLVDGRQQGPTSVWPARVKFMLSLGLRARRTPPLIPGVLHSHNSSARRLTRWLPRRPGTLPPPLRGARSFAAYSIAIAFGAGVGFIAYENYQPFRHSVLAVVRCSRVAGE